MKAIVKNRVGGTVEQPNNYQAFIPNELYPNGPEIKLDSEIFRLNSEADRALGELNSVTILLPNHNLFIGGYVKKEALLSSQIEGTQCSLVDIIQADENTNEIKPVHEVINYIKAMEHALKELKNIPFSLRLIQDIHSLLMYGVRGGDKYTGEFRRSQNWIGPPGCTLDEAYFIPPPPDMVIKLMGDLELYYHQEEQLPILIKAAILHSHFETIHPFIDGNGRLGRLLITFLLCEKKILDKPLLYLSLFFKENKSSYYDLLMKTRTEGDLESWIKFFLRGVRNTSREAVKAAKEIIELREKQREIINKNIQRAVYAHQIYDFLCQSPVYPLAKVVKELKIPYPTVKRTIDQFEESKIVKVQETKAGKTVHLTEYLNILLRGTE
jgi:Fic family protein